MPVMACQRMLRSTDLRQQRLPAYFADQVVIGITSRRQFIADGQNLGAGAGAKEGQKSKNDQGTHSSGSFRM